MKLCIAFAMALAIFFASVPVVPAQDETDNFGALRNTMTGLGIRRTANNASATAEAGEPVHSGVNAATGSVWWTWTSDADSAVQIHTLGSEFNTVLAVYTGADLASLTKIADNDDYVSGIDLRSVVQFDAAAGTVYHIAVDGFDGDKGNIVLRIRDPSAAPVNDNFADRIFLPSSMNVVVVDSNANAIPETGEAVRSGFSPQAST